MSGTSKIEWTDATWNPLRVRLKEPLEIPGRRDDGGQHFKILPAGTWGYHCERVSPGCINCYAEAMNGRTLPAWGTGLDYTRQSRDKVDIYLDEEELLKPLRWKKQRMVFVCSMTDLFAEFVPNEFIVKMFTVMESAYWHTFQVLTKRSERMCLMLSHPHFPSYVRKFGYDWLGPKQYNERGPHWRQNQWLGVSVEDQQRADERIPHLLATPAAVRWVSYEPALGPVNFCSVPVDPCIRANVLIRWSDHPFGSMLTPNARIDWIVAGGESGPGARPCNLAWLRSVRDQCAAAAVPCFMKQLGARPYDDRSARKQIDHYFNFKNRKGGDPAEWPEDLRVRQMPAAAGARA